MRGYTIDKSIELLEKDVKMLKESGAGGTSAELVRYNNQDTSLRSTTVQGALTELDDNVSSNVGMIEQLQLDVVNAELDIEELKQLTVVQSGAVTNLGAVASTYRMRLKKCGNIVSVNFYFGLNAVTDNLTQWLDLFQLPSGFYNTDNHLDFVMNDFDKNSYQAMISTTGQVRFVPRAVISQGRLCVVNLTYILG